MIDVLPLVPVNDYITRKYNYVRLCLYSLIAYHSYMESYLEEYKLYLKKVEREFPIIHTLKKKKEIFTLSVIAKNAKKYHIKNKRNDTIYIIGKEDTKKYRRLVQLCKQLYSYGKRVEEYIRYLERNIISITKNMTTFKDLYKLHISMCLEREKSDETLLMREKLEKIKMKHVAIS